MVKRSAPGRGGVARMTCRRWPAVWLLVVMSVGAAPAPHAEQTEDAAAPSVQYPDLGDQPIGSLPRLTIRPAMLAGNIEHLAGREVTIFNARVVGVFEPDAFLIESATRRPESMGHRDRVLVLLDGGTLRVPAELLVGSTVKVIGVARTLLSLKVTAEVPWPAQLDPELVERLEVRASVLATSVQTAEGVELSERRSGAPARR